MRQYTAQELIEKNAETPNDEKFRELILYIADQCKDFEHFDDEKLQAILFFSDLESYRRTGHSITGQRYVKAS